MGRLDKVANICVIVGVVVFLAFVGQQEWARHRANEPATQKLVGETIKLPGYHLDGKKQALVLAISTTCHFCRDSEPFYRELAGKLGGRVPMVAVLPQPLSEAQSYVKAAIGSSVHVVSEPLDSIGVTGTPTLMLVDSAGRVTKAWIGKLDGSGQQQVESLVM